MNSRAAIFAMSLLAAHAFAGEAMHAHDAHSHDAHAHDAHAMHHHADASEELARSTSTYAMPQVSVLRQDGRRVDFARDIDDGRPIFLNFIYTTCTAICPPMTQTFATLQRKLGADRDKVRMVSVSIDPEHDTPRRLAEYAEQFGAGPQWTFYTGTVESSVAVQKAFAAYRGDKMSHTPLTLVRSGRGAEWVRLDGFATADQLLQEYRRIVTAAR
jgi:protein SCO1